MHDETRENSDSLLAIGWFVPGVWTWYSYIKTAWIWASAAQCIRTALFCDVTQRVVVIHYRNFGTTYRSNFQGLRACCLEDGADLLSRNIVKELPVYCPYCTRTAQFSYQTNNNFTLKLRWYQQTHNCTSYIHILLFNLCMFQHFRHLQ
jgi:hypothetical protein